MAKIIILRDFFSAKLQICLPLSYYVNGSFETMFCIQITFGLVRVQQKWSSFESNRMAKWLTNKCAKFNMLHTRFWVPDTQIGSNSSLQDIASNRVKIMTGVIDYNYFPETVQWVEIFHDDRRNIDIF